MTGTATRPDGTADELSGGQSIFETDWHIYRSLVDNNLFCHREVSRVLVEEISARFPDGVRFLDLACGDADVISRALNKLNVLRYHGVDLSPQALAIAGKTLAAAPFETVLEEKDILGVLSESPESYDVIWCGLCLHHFHSWHEKAEVLSAVRKALRPGGLFLSFEPVLAEGVTRDTFNRQNRPHFKQAWTPALSPAEFDRMMHHIETCDFPETAQGWINAGLKGGFRRAATLFAMPGDGYCQMFRFEK